MMLSQQTYLFTICAGAQLLITRVELPVGSGQVERSMTGGDPNRTSDYLVSGPLALKPVEPGQPRRGCRV